MNVSNSSR